jgi:hypothetical protein
LQSLAKRGATSRRGKTPLISHCGNAEHALDLIQIKVASDTSSSVDAGSGTDAANDPAIHRKRDSACRPQARTEAEGRAAGAWKSSRFYF